MLNCSHIDNGFFRVSDRVAGTIARTLSPVGKLPDHDKEIRFTIDGKSGWLTRTPYRFYTDSPKRGWVWAIYAINPHECPSLNIV